MAKHTLQRREAEAHGTTKHKTHDHTKQKNEKGHSGH